MNKKIKQYLVLFLGCFLLLSSCKIRRTEKINRDSNFASNYDTINRNSQIIDTISFTTFNITSGSRKPKALSTLDFYNAAFEELKNMLKGSKPLDFKKAVFITENTYYKDYLDFKSFSSSVDELVNICREWMGSNSLTGYTFSDSTKVKTNGAIFQLMKDTIFLTKELPLNSSYQYNFDDFTGKKDWSNQFITKLITTGSGNCHSLPYLYKILANELNTEAYLSLAPNHIYIKHRSKKWGWYNTELTSGEFPTDAWIKASGYVTLNAIRNGVYMDTLGQKESVALCVYDLAMGYYSQTGNYSDGFIIKCCNLVLNYHPSNINAIILKAETIKKQYSNFKELYRQEEAAIAFEEMQELYVYGLKLGYREMPQEMYMSWLASINEQKEKYNSNYNPTFKSK